MEQKLDARTARIVLAWISWLEFVVGSPATDYLGYNDDFTPNQEAIERFAELYEANGSYDNIEMSDLDE